MKKFLLILLLLAPFSAFTNWTEENLVSKNLACSYKNGNYDTSLEIKGYKNASAISFTKFNNTLYYLVQEIPDINYPYNKNYLVYSYNCLNKKASKITWLTWVQKKYIGSVYTLSNIVAKEWNSIYINFNPDGIGCTIENGNECDIWYYQVELNLKTRNWIITKNTLRFHERIKSFSF